MFSPLLLFAVCVGAQSVWASDYDYESSTTELPDLATADSGLLYYASDECTPTPTVFSYLQEIYQINRREPVRKQVADLSETIDIIDHLANISTALFNIEMSKNQLAQVLELFYEIDVTDQCFVALVRLGKGIAQRKLWALKFLDSVGKLPTGIMEGTMSHFGEFDECLDILQPNESLNPIRGQYCLAKFILPYPGGKSGKRNQSNYPRDKIDLMSTFFQLYNLESYLTMDKLIELLNNQNGVTFRLGVCFPAACTADEFETLLNQLLYPITRMPIELGPDCYEKQPSAPAFDPYQYWAIIIFSSLLLTNLSCTLMDVVMTAKYGTFSTGPNASNRIFSQLVESFSLVRNARILVSHKRSKQSHCIDVVRLLLILNVCIDQMFLFAPFMSFMSFKRLLNSVITKVHYYNKYFFARNILILDTLFMISGILLTCNLLRRFATRSLSVQSYGLIVARIWFNYSVPMLATVLLFWLLPLTGDGPIWNIGMQLLLPACRCPESLKDSFAYLSNYRINSTLNVFNFATKFSLCNPPTWLLSAVFQLQAIGILFVYLIKRDPRRSLLLAGVMVLLGCYASIFTNQTGSQSPVEEMTRTFLSFHIGVHHYIVAFFIGIITGYLIYSHSVRQKFQPFKHEAWIWISAVGSLILVLYWFQNLYQLGQNPPARSAVCRWFAIGKPIACISVAWILYALCIGRAVFIERILSCRLLRILSRLSLSIYVLHFIPMSHRLFSVRDTYVMTDRLLFEFLVIDLLITTALAVALYLLIEKPFHNLSSRVFSLLDIPDVDVLSLDFDDQICRSVSTETVEEELNTSNKEILTTTTTTEVYFIRSNSIN